LSRARIVAVKKEILIFRHFPTEGPGYLSRFLDRRSIPHRTIKIDAGEPVPESIADIRGIVLMGGPMSVNDRLPWIPPLLQLIRSAVAAEIPLPDVAATGLVNPAAGTTPGLATVFAQLIRPADLGALGPAGQAIVRIRIFGTTLGGQEIESGDYDFPIQVCDGCLISYPSEAADPTAPGNTYLCSYAADTESTTDQICSLGQDDVVPCTECAAFNGVCRDPALNQSVVPATP
jgi:hypothetical protein